MRAKEPLKKGPCSLSFPFLESILLTFSNTHIYSKYAFIYHACGVSPLRAAIRSCLGRRRPCDGGYDS